MLPTDSKLKVFYLNIQFQACNFVNFIFIFQIATARNILIIYLNYWVFVSLLYARQVVCYCTSVSACRAVLPVLNGLPCAVLPVVVGALPRNACVELHAWAHHHHDGRKGGMTRLTPPAGVGLLCDRY